LAGEASAASSAVSSRGRFGAKKFLIDMVVSLRVVVKFCMTFFVYLFDGGGNISRKNCGIFSPKFIEHVPGILFFSNVKGMPLYRHDYAFVLYAAHVIETSNANETIFTPRSIPTVSNVPKLHA